MVTKSGVVGPGTDRTEVYRHGRKIVFCVDGHHTTDAALQATQYLIALITDISGPVELVADLRNVTGFAKEARSIGRKHSKGAVIVIGLITLVQGTPLARMAASAVGLYAGIKVRSVETIEDALKETNVD